MTRAVSLVIAAAAIAVAGWSGHAAQAPPAVILVTLDGARVQEMFGGLDVAVLKSTLGTEASVEANPTFQRFWASTPEARRSRLLPFFWDTLMRDAGSIAGNRALGSDVHVTNQLWFSYPGYSELLVGAAHDDVIKSNDATQNPYPTVLEFLRRKLGTSPNGVGLFSTWNVFRAIGESRPGTIAINAGYERYDHPDPAIRALGDRQFETQTPWNSVRHDLYTFQFAMAHLATYRPRVLYLALGETDDWAHDGRYDRVLEAYSRSDRYLEGAVGLGAGTAGLPGPDEPAHHHRPRTRSNGQRLASASRLVSRSRRYLDGVRVPGAPGSRGVARSRPDHGQSGRRDADRVDGLRLARVQSRRRSARRRALKQAGNSACIAATRARQSRYPAMPAFRDAVLARPHGTTRPMMRSLISCAAAIVLLSASVATTSPQKTRTIFVSAIANKLRSRT